MDIRATAPGAVTGGVTGGESSASESQRTQLAHLAQEFEAMFLTEMLRGMRESLLSEEQDKGLGADTMTNTFDGELGRALSTAGGLGLAKVMLEALSKRGPDAMSAATVLPGASSVSAPMPADPSLALASTGRAGEQGSSLVPVAGGAPAAVAFKNSGSAALPGPVTSPFGWRADPFTGRPQFHAGTDVRLAYGQDVEAVASGKVSAVGDRSGYGLTVVIDHGDGLETRYAHLSDTTVRVGDTVEAGQVVARSGNSGRSTGPHLHLEARRNGKAIEMASLLKSQAGSADSYADDRSNAREWP